jgi:glycosyltransferase involved in cell wall biosynthesis
MTADPHGSDAGDRRQPRICLCMIVRNEAHIIHDLIEAVASSIDTWVIVDTGSTDGTQDLIRRLMAERAIPGQLFERPWRNFGSNRTEALELAQGRGDYIWMMDADDTIRGAIDFRGLTADGYSMRIREAALYWRLQLFRDGVPWRYVGVLHEAPVCDVPHTQRRLEGDYRIESRRLGDRNRDPQKYARDAAILQAEVDRHPNDARSTFYLAQSHFDAGDFASARRWYARRAEMGGWHEEVFYALYRVALAMQRLDEPWPTVQDAFQRAWSYRPSRAEPLYVIARHYRVAGEYRLGHLFAERAARIALPIDDVLFVAADVYEWRAADEQAVCASWIGMMPETFAICERLLARDDLPAADRTRITANRDLAARAMRRADAPASTTPST